MAGFVRLAGRGAEIAARNDKSERIFVNLRDRLGSATVSQPCQEPCFFWFQPMAYRKEKNIVYSKHSFGRAKTSIIYMVL